MGACIAAAVACSAFNFTPQKPRAHFTTCGYCGRSPDHEQKVAQCVSCGAPLQATFTNEGGYLCDSSVRELVAKIPAKRAPENPIGWESSDLMDPLNPLSPLHASNQIPSAPLFAYYPTE